MKQPAVQGNTVPRPPVIVIMGHIDHGKSTLLDYIRKSNVVAGEAGGITQHLSAYEVTHTTKEGRTQRITFLDTPGHEAFSQMRYRGARVADIAVLVVSAEDGVKAQTKEALASIKEAKVPYMVAINKIDKPTANIEKTKNSLVENEIYLEGYGGDIPAVPISAKSGQGVSDLLDMMLLVADLQGLTGTPSKPAEGIVIEARIDPKKGTSATLVIKDGTLRRGMCIVAEESLSPVRAIEDFTGKQVPAATFSSPIRITGFDHVPPVGATFFACEDRKAAEALVAEHHEAAHAPKKAPEGSSEEGPESVTITLVINADASGTLEAIEKELGKLSTDKVHVLIVRKNVGAITESDIKAVAGATRPFVIGFNVKIDAQAHAIADRMNIPIEVFDIIYKLTERLTEEIILRTPKRSEEHT